MQASMLAAAFNPWYALCRAQSPVKSLRRWLGPSWLSLGLGFGVGVVPKPTRN